MDIAAASAGTGAEGRLAPPPFASAAPPASRSRKTSTTSSSAEPWQKNVLCKYYVNGMCTRGVDCTWSHDVRAHSNRKTLPCKYFSAGTCAYGDNCRFSHGNEQYPPLNPFAPEFKAPEGSVSTPPTSPSSSVLSVTSTPPSMHEGQVRISPPFHHPAMAVQQHVIPTSSSSSSWANAPVFVPKGAAAVATSTTKINPNASCFVPAAARASAAGDSAASAVGSRHHVQAAGPKTWAQVVRASTGGGGGKAATAGYDSLSVADAESQLCPFSMAGLCRYGDHCDYVHGLTCDMCQTNCLHPYHQRQREQHQKTCLSQHESEMEVAFAVQRSKEKTCGICMEVVMEKKGSEARFGIMPNCNHCYCLECLRKWRKAKQFEHKIVRACPECRVTSDYICPSKYWIDTKEEKDKLLGNYKIELQKKQCRYFNLGKGDCPFGNKCFYRHEDAKGIHVDIGPPEAQKRRVVHADADVVGDTDTIEMQRVLLTDFLNMRLSRESGTAANLPLEEILDMLELFSDSDDDDW